MSIQSILPLPPDVISQIKSSIAITSINAVIYELVKNSLDAGCTKLDINVDYAKGACVVEDNGVGILPSEFRDGGGLGKLHHSSKLNSKTPVHGTRGAFLASLSAVALLTITSHHHRHHSHNSIGMHKSEVISRQTPAPPHQHLLNTDHGTRVTIRDLFGNMPVRVKQRALTAEKYRGNNKDWEELKRSIALLLLSWPESVAVAVREVGTVQKIIIRLPAALPDKMSSRSHGLKICSVLSQAAILAPEETSSWVEVSASTNNLNVSGSISLEPSATKNVQFISFGIQPLLPTENQTVLHLEMNRLFANSAFGNEEEAEELDDVERLRRTKDARYKSHGYTNRELKGGKKGVEKWPMFYINIRQREASQRYEGLNVDDVLDDKRSNLSVILELLQAMIYEFLTRHHFRPKNRRKVHFQDDLKGLDRESLRAINSSTQVDDRADIQRPASGPNLQQKSKSKNQSRSFSNRPRSSVSSGDLSGTNIKFPSFRRISTPLEFAFDTWSKVKKGNAPLASTAYKRSADLESPVIASYVAIFKSTPQNPMHPPLLSSTGRVIRRPFEEVQTHKSRPILEKPAVSQKNTPVADPTGDDDVVEWINPTTKVKSFVNRRTGHTVPARSTAHSKNGIRVLSEGPAFSRSNIKRTSDTSSDGPSPWLSSLLQKWENPVFVTAQLPIHQVSIDEFDDSTRHIIHGHQHVCTQIDIDRAFKVSSRINGRISKDALRHAKVISQVDNKFILAKVDTRDGPSEDGKMLVIIDQHAADERIRVEKLIEKLCSPNNGESESCIHTTTLEKPIHFEISVREIELLHANRRHFSRWGILFTLPPPISVSRNKEKNKRKCLQKVSITSLPPGIMERCRSDPRLLIDLIRTEAWKCEEKATIPSFPTTSSPISKGESAWFKEIHTCPRGILDLLNSRACRGAIMFNDPLSREQCEGLVRRLAECVFPFMCAHGRPSLVPLVELGTGDSRYGALEIMEGGAGADQKTSFGASMRIWRDEMRRGG